ncbi:MAG: cupredoxin domain-containing protein [Nitrospirota bacterium]|mgnify:CR=1 FL=1
MRKLSDFISLYATAFVISLALLPVPAFAGPGQEVTFTASINSENVNVWLPSTLTVHKGDKVKLTLKNNGTKDHGFTIDGLDLAEVIAMNQSKEVVIHADKAGAFQFFCQLHKAHVGGQIVVE